MNKFISLRSTHWNIETFFDRFGIYVLLAALIFTGSVLVGDYNIASDEPVNRKSGGISANLVINKVNRILDTSFFENDMEFKKFDTDLNFYIDRDYGVAFDLPAFLIERFLQIDDSRTQYLLRHYLNFLIFICGLFAFYKILIQRFANAKLALLLVAMLAVSPRILPDAFYNYKDVLFLSATVISVWTLLVFLRRPTIKSIILHGLAVAFAIDIRILGVMVWVGTFGIILLLLLRKKIGLHDALKYMSIFFISSICFTILFWPWLWINPLKFDLWHIPVDRFTEAFLNMSRFRWEGLIHFRGFYYPSQGLPWFYLPYWIAITTPVVYLCLMMLGGTALVIRVIKSALRLWPRDQDFLDLIFVTLAIVPILAIVTLKSVVYDGWRQIYFVYPWLIVIAGVGIEAILSMFSGKTNFIKITYIAIILYMVNISLWMYKVHPYQMVYFNEFISKARAAQFELDYWGQSTKEAINYVYQNDDKYQIKLYSIGNTTIEQTLTFMGPQMANVFVLTEDPYDADYLIYNHRITAFWNMPILEYAQKSRDVFYQVITDGQVIFTVYR
jgi:hypothetical protein